VISALPHIADDETLARAVQGAVELRREADGLHLSRLPRWTHAQLADESIARFADQTSGMRLRFTTAATRIAVEATFTRIRSASAVTPAHRVTVIAEADGASHFAQREEGDELVESADRSAVRVHGGQSRIQFDLGGDGVTERDVTIWLPNAAATTLHSVAASMPLAAMQSSGPRWVHYGSSISHGSDLPDPRDPWPMRVARHHGMSLVNLGFAGNAMLDPFVARTIAQLEADVITLKVGINLVNGDVMRDRIFTPALHGFLDLVREGHPATPVVLISPLACPIHERTPGPTREASPGKAGAFPGATSPGDGRLTLERVRTLMADAVRSRTDGVRYLNGLDLLGIADDERLPDNLHPDTLGHELIAQRFSAAISSGDVPGFAPRN
jgi:lysophospholipase L1-like esterase